MTGQSLARSPHGTERGAVAIEHCSGVRSMCLPAAGWTLLAAQDTAVIGGEDHWSMMVSAGCDAVAAAVLMSLASREVRSVLTGAVQRTASSR